MSPEHKSHFFLRHPVYFHKIGPQKGLDPHLPPPSLTKVKKISFKFISKILLQINGKSEFKLKGKRAKNIVLCLFDVSLSAWSVVRLCVYDIEFSYWPATLPPAPSRLLPSVVKSWNPIKNFYWYFQPSLAITTSKCWILS